MFILVNFERFYRALTLDLFNNLTFKIHLRMKITSINKTQPQQGYSRVVHFVNVALSNGTMNMHEQLMVEGKPSLSIIRKLGFIFM